MELSSDRLTAYARDGYLFYPSLFSPSEMDNGEDFTVLVAASA